MTIAIREKIKKLLALAASANEAEAELAMLHAQRMMDEYRISVIELDDAPEKIVKDDLPLLESGRLPGWKQSLCMILCRYNNCKIVKYTGNRNTRLMIFGKPSDIEHVRYLLAFLVLQLTQYGKIACIGEGHRYADSWYAGAVQGIGAKMFDGRKEATTDLPQFMLVKFNKEMSDVEDFVSTTLGKLRKGTASNSKLNYDAYHRGHAVGKSLDTGSNKSLPKPYAALGMR